MNFVSTELCMFCVVHLSQNTSNVLFDMFDLGEGQIVPCHFHLGAGYDIIGGVLWPVGCKVLFQSVFGWEKSVTNLASDGYFF